MKSARTGVVASVPCLMAVVLWPRLSSPGPFMCAGLGA